MRVINKLLLSIFFIGFYFACQSSITKSETQLDYVEGDVLVSLADGYSEKYLKPRIEELQLEWMEYFEHLNVALIGVPFGEEDYWIEILKEEPMISNAHKNRKVELRD